MRGLTADCALDVHNLPLLWILGDVSRVQVQQFFDDVEEVVARHVHDAFAPRECHVSSLNFEDGLLIHGTDVKAVPRQGEELLLEDQNSLRRRDELLKEPDRGRNGLKLCHDARIDEA